MKKLLTTIAALAALGCGLLSAQAVQYSVDLSPFSAVDISGPFEVSLVRGQQPRALISVLDPYKEYVICSVDAGVLSIGLDEKKVPSDVKRQFRGKGTPDPVYSAIVYVPDLLQAVTMSGKAVLRDTEDVFDKSRTVFTLDGQASVMTLNVSSLVFSLDMRGKSTADLKAVCRETSVTLSGSSSLTMDEQTDKSQYNLSGSSKARVKSKTMSFNVIAKANASMTLAGSSDGANYELAGTSEVDASLFEVSDADVRMTSVTRLSVAAANVLRVNLNGGSTLQFLGDPSVVIDNVRSASMTRLPGDGNTTKL
ncbi:MAG: DUF2807 domain-containing protein [Bacteroidales bacterium]|nr:DUF2807 domain-containing protein [Bacteroidales bacterium]MBO4565722.1 DUF2807 domain-containing protein [Bacteroidales bacterium]